MSQLVSPQRVTVTTSVVHPPSAHQGQRRRQPITAFVDPHHGLSLDSESSPTGASGSEGSFTRAQMWHTTVSFFETLTSSSTQQRAARMSKGEKRTVATHSIPWQLFLLACRYLELTVPWSDVLRVLRRCQYQPPSSSAAPCSASGGSGALLVLDAVQFDDALEVVVSLHLEIQRHGEWRRPATRLDRSHGDISPPPPSPSAQNVHVSALSTSRCSASSKSAIPGSSLFWQAVWKRSLEMIDYRTFLEEAFKPPICPASMFTASVLDVFHAYHSRLQALHRALTEEKSHTDWATREGLWFVVERLAAQFRPSVDATGGNSCPVVDARQESLLEPPRWTADNIRRSLTRAGVNVGVWLVESPAAQDEPPLSLNRVCEMLAFATCAVQFCIELERGSGPLRPGPGGICGPSVGAEALRAWTLASFSDILGTLLLPEDSFHDALSRAVYCAESEDTARRRAEDESDERHLRFVYLFYAASRGKLYECTPMTKDQVLQLVDEWILPTVSTARQATRSTRQRDQQPQHSERATTNLSRGARAHRSISDISDSSSSSALRTLVAESAAGGDGTTVTFRRFSHLMDEAARIASGCGVDHRGRRALLRALFESPCAKKAWSVIGAVVPVQLALHEATQLLHGIIPPATASVWMPLVPNVSSWSDVVRAVFHSLLRSCRNSSSSTPTPRVQKGTGNTITQCETTESRPKSAPLPRSVPTSFIVERLSASTVIPSVVSRVDVNHLLRRIFMDDEDEDEPTRGEGGGFLLVNENDLRHRQQSENVPNSAHHARCSVSSALSQEQFSWFVVLLAKSPRHQLAFPDAAQLFCRSLFLPGSQQKASAASEAVSWAKALR